MGGRGQLCNEASWPGIDRDSGAEVVVRSNEDTCWRLDIAASILADKLIKLQASSNLRPPDFLILVPIDLRGRHKRDLLFSGIKRHMSTCQVHDQNFSSPAVTSTKTKGFALDLVFWFQSAKLRASTSLT